MNVGDHVRLNVSSAGIRARPSDDSPWVSEAVYGMSGVVVGAASDRRWVDVKWDSDGYRGWLACADLIGRDSIAPPTHRVVVPLSNANSEPDCTTPSTLPLAMHARVAVAGTNAYDEGALWSELAVGGYVPASHLQPLDAVCDATAPQIGSGRHAAEIAHQFLYAPYRWGGRTAWGIDCSGLVQVALWAVGRPCERDSRPQCDAWRAYARSSNDDDGSRSDDGGVAAVVTPSSGLPSFVCGDLLYWRERGHVAFGWHDGYVLHANAFTMNVAIETLATVNARVGEHPQCFRLSAGRRRDASASQ